MKTRVRVVGASQWGWDVMGWDEWEMGRDSWMRW